MEKNDSKKKSAAGKKDSIPSSKASSKKASIKNSMKTPSAELKTVRKRKSDRNAQESAEKDAVIKPQAAALDKKKSIIESSNKKNAFYELLTDEAENSNEDEHEEIDPESLARGDTPMTVVEHLNELRSRIIQIILSFLILASICFYFSDFLLYYINKPFLESGNKLNIFTLIGGFMLRFKISAAVSLIILIPMIIFHIWRFIVPAIEQDNRTFSRATILSAIILFYSGICFVFFILLPAAIKVMLSFVGTEMLTTIGADDYLSFIFFFCLAMGVLFELPVFILILSRIGLVSPQFLIKKRKYAIVMSWVIAAIITPQPDPLSQSLVAVPLMLLYEISIVISRFTAKRALKKN